MYRFQETPVKASYLQHCQVLAAWVAILCDIQEEDGVS